MGRADYLDLGTWNAACSCCGFKFKANELSRNWQGMYRCWRCQEPRHPQDYVRGQPDHQSTPWTQPQNATYGNWMLGIDEDTTLSYSDAPAGGPTTVIITISGPVVVLTLDDDFPPGTVIVINVPEGTVLQLLNDSDVTPTVQGLGLLQEPELAFQVQPSTTDVDAVITPAIEVVVMLGGSILDTDVAEVTLEIGANPGGGTLSGTLTQTTVDGVATFDDLSIDEDGDGYTLIASADIAGIEDETSAPFDIEAEGWELVAGTLTNGVDVIEVGFITTDGTQGSITPNLLNGRTFLDVMTCHRVPDVPFFFQIAISGALVPQSFFTSVTVGATTLLTSAADSYAGNTWIWTTGAPNLFPSIGTYEVVFVI